MTVENGQIILDNNEIYIKGNVPSSKNSKIITKNKRIICSKVVRKYLKEYGYQWEDVKNRDKFLWLAENRTSKRIRVNFLFIRDSKRIFDYQNIAQLPCDLMQKYGWIENDNAYVMTPVYDENFFVNKDLAGVVISVL